MLGGLLTYGIGQIDSFPVWKAIFLVCGGMTVIWGVILLFFLPDSIMDARFFDTDEKALLIARARSGRTGVLNKHVKWYQIKEALLDPQVWILTLFVLLNEIINGGVANFGKLIVKGLVQDPLQTTALGIPQGAFQVLWILTGTFLASKVNNFRTYVMALYLIPTIIGVSLMWKIDRDSHMLGALFGYYIQGSFVASLVLALQLPSTNLGGYTKRTTASATVFLAYCAGNIIGPHAFLEDEAPRYPTGCIVIMCCASVQLLLAVVLRLFLIWRNKKRDAIQLEAVDAVVPEHQEGSDLTDFEVSIPGIMFRIYITSISFLTKTAESSFSIRAIMKRSRYGSLQTACSKALRGILSTFLWQLRQLISRVTHCALIFATGMLFTTLLDRVFYVS